MPTEAADSREEGQYDNMIVFSPYHPATVDEDEIAQEIGKGYQEVGSHELTGFVSIVDDTDGILSSKDVNGCVMDRNLERG